MTLRPVSSVQADLSLDTSRFVDTAGGGREMFDIKVLRAQITYQATSRLAFRNISQWDSYDKTLDLNLLATYRVNAGTVFYAGYDDHHRQGDRIDGDPDGDGDDRPLFSSTRLRRTNRAVFLKLQYCSATKVSRCKPKQSSPNSPKLNRLCVFGRYSNPPTFCAGIGIRPIDRSRIIPAPSSACMKLLYFGNERLDAQNLATSLREITRNGTTVSWTRSADRASAWIARTGTSPRWWWKPRSMRLSGNRC